MLPMYATPKDVQSPTSPRSFRVFAPSRFRDPFSLPYWVLSTQYSVLSTLYRVLRPLPSRHMLPCAPMC